MMEYVLHQCGCQAVSMATQSNFKMDAYSGRVMRQSWRRIYSKWSVDLFIWGRLSGNNKWYNVIFCQPCSQLVHILLTFLVETDTFLVGRERMDFYIFPAVLLLNGMSGPPLYVKTVFYITFKIPELFVKVPLMDVSYSMALFSPNWLILRALPMKLKLTTLLKCLKILVSYRHT